MIQVKILVSILVITLIVGNAAALPEILDVFNAKYDTRGTRLDTCETCHISNKDRKSTCDELCHVPNKAQKVENNLNQYGVSVKKNLDIEIPLALSKIEYLDSDSDGFTNIAEIDSLTFPGNKKDFPRGKKFYAFINSLLNFSLNSN